MLATPASSVRRLAPGPWRLETKFDGWRGVATVEGGRVRIASRHGQDLTGALPELQQPPPGLVGRAAVLDGELVVGAGTASDFYRLGPRLARGPRTARGACPVTFVAFDVLSLDGVSLRDEPYHRRRAVLEAARVDEGCWRTADSLSGDPEQLLAACERLDVEGLVAKRLDGLYRPGQRSTDWIKLKTPAWTRVHGPRRHER